MKRRLKGRSSVVEGVRGGAGIAGARRRRRNRRRIRSENFRSLWWVVLREAALRICYPTALGTPVERSARSCCASPDSTAVRGLAERLLDYHPERRWWDR